MSVQEFIKHNFRHFNAAVVVDAAEAYCSHLAQGGKMFLAMAGAMSTAELGLSLAEMIRQDKIHAICTTGANLEEDIFNLVAHNHYRRVPNYRNLTDDEELALRERGLNRVTDTCIPEEEAMRRIERQVLKYLAKGRPRRPALLPLRIHVPAHPQLHHHASSTRSIPRTPGSMPPARKICPSLRRDGKTPRSAIFLWPMSCAATSPIFRS